MSGKLEGATYDPFSGKWLFIQDLSNAKTITRVSLDYGAQTSATISNTIAPFTASALAVGGTVGRHRSGPRR